MPRVIQIFRMNVFFTILFSLLLLYFSFVFFSRGNSGKLSRWFVGIKSPLVVSWCIACEAMWRSFPRTASALVIHCTSFARFLPRRPRSRRQASNMSRATSPSLLYSGSASLSVKSLHYKPLESELQDLSRR